MARPAAHRFWVKPVFVVRRGGLMVKPIGDRNAGISIPAHRALGPDHSSEKVPDEVPLRRSAAPADSIAADEPDPARRAALGVVLSAGLDAQDLRGLGPIPEPVNGEYSAAVGELDLRRVAPEERLALAEHWLTCGRAASNLDRPGLRVALADRELGIVDGEVALDEISGLLHAFQCTFPRSAQTEKLFQCFLSLHTQLAEEQAGWAELISDSLFS